MTINEDDSKKGATLTKPREENMTTNPLKSQQSEQDNQIQNVVDARTRSNEDKVLEGISLSLSLTSIAPMLGWDDISIASFIFASSKLN